MIGIASANTHNALPADFVIQVHNRHAGECGEPPRLRLESDSAEYMGYFENSFGEQFTVVIDRQAKTGALRGGDLGWQEEFPIAGDRVKGDLILGREEFAWLSACWNAATGKQLRKPAWFHLFELVNATTKGNRADVAN